MGNKVDRGDPEEMRRKWQEAEEQHAAAEAAAAEGRRRRAAELQRAKQRRMVERFFVPDDELVQSDDEPCDAGDGLACTSSQHHGAQRGAGAPQPPRLSHAQRRLRFEQRFQEHSQLGVQYRALFGPQHAAAQEHDHTMQFAVLQQRVQEYVAGGALHPGCSGRVEVASWRPIFLRTLLGTGVLSIPTCRCAQRM